MQHSFDIDIASDFGILEAILLNNLWYWIKKNEANQKNYYDGYYWTFNSTKAFNILFPYVSQRQIMNALKKLKEAGVIQTGNYNKLAYDRTLWYAFTKKGECIMQKCKMEDVKMLNGDVENVTPIPNNKPINKTSNKKQYIYYGEYKNVFFTEEQYIKLLNEFPNDYQERIDNLDNYIQSKGTKYKDCLATIRNWSRKEKSKGENNNARNTEYKKYNKQKLDEPELPRDRGIF